MIVNREITRQEKSSVKLTLTIPQAEVQSQYDTLIKKYAGQIQIPGFRKGKAPVHVVEQKIGEAVREENLGTVMETALQEVFQSEDFPREDLPLAYSTPSLAEEFEKDFEKDLSFSVVYDVFPRVSIENWKGYEVQVPDVNVDKAAIQSELEAIQERNAIVIDKNEGEGAKNGDILTVNYAELDEEGQIIPGSEREDFVFTLGTELNIYKFDTELEGMKKGETKEFTKTFGPEENNKDLAGTTKKIRVSLTLIKEKQLPALDDELAQDVDERFKTLADLEDDIKKKLGEHLEKKLREIKISAILEKIIEKHNIDIPQSMIDMEMDGRWRNMARQFGMDVQQVKQLFAANQEQMETISQEWLAAAEKSLKARLIIESLINDLKLQASEEEVKDLVQQMADEAKVSVEEVNKYYATEQMQEQLLEEVKERKLQDLLIAENKIKKGKKTTYLDLMANNG